LRTLLGCDDGKTCVYQSDINLKTGVSWPLRSSSATY
jgi:hypothetical protein